MNESLRHKKLWRILHAVICPVFRRMLNYSCEEYNPETPALIIANHVTNYDPFLVACSFPKHQMYFVASEHLFRKGWRTKAINYLVAPISRRKGSNGGDTALAMLRKLRAGHSVCIFGEGETTWNGVAQKIFAGTGDIAKIGKVNLMTYRIEGGYLSAPRWGKGIRKGKMYGSIVNTYTPEQLSHMSSQELNDAVNRDISENAWERQKESPQRFKGKKRAEQIETALFICPECHKQGTVYGTGNHVRCSCGLDTVYTEYGTFDPPKPFENILQWDEWQHDYLKNAETLPAFRDEDIKLFELQQDHSENLLAQDVLTLEDNTLLLGQYRFPLENVSHFALVQKHLMVFTYQGKYYEMHAPKPICLRKYLAVWHNVNAKGA
ncbi:MAG: 1-acyl-sn-glycerol-3-phosphate acyltransferase [Clostridiales bacterium]|nr:1-acyl-sn-glycerol-3-phosphate acyltransferase [Clostridiales bacterium]